MWQFGGTNFANVNTKEVIAEALKIKAPKIILVHNHPSGDPTPSENDFKATEKIYNSAEMFGIQLLDHVAIGDGKYTSIFSEMIKKQEGR